MTQRNLQFDCMVVVMKGNSLLVAAISLVILADVGFAACPGSISYGSKSSGTCSNTTTTATCDVACETGYTGSSEIFVCSGFNEWTGTEPTCTAVLQISGSPTLQLEVTGGTVEGTLDIDFTADISSFPIFWGNLSVKEGFFPGISVEPTSAVVSGSNAFLTFDATSLISVSYASNLSYSISINSNLFSTVPFDQIDNMEVPTTFIGEDISSLTFSTSEIVCLDISAVTTVDQLRTFAEGRCTIIVGSVDVDGVTATAQEWLAAFGTIRETEGYIRIENSNGFTFAAFPDLHRISSGNPPDMYTYDGKDYGLFIRNNDGFQAPDVASLQGRIGNGMIYMADNPGTCFTPEQMEGRFWGHSDVMYLSHVTSDCPGSICSMIEDGSNCVSSCASCEQTCAGRTITTKEHLDSYKDRDCAYITGFLKIVRLENVTEETLEVFSQVKVIEHVLVITDNPTLISLDFLRSLETVPVITITDNANLVDARLPSLINPSNMTINVDTDSNPRLCEAANPDGAGPPCGIVNIYHHVVVTGIQFIEFDEEEVKTALFAAVPSISAYNVTLETSAEGLASRDVTVRVEVPNVPVEESWAMLNAMHRATTSATGYAWLDELRDVTLRYSAVTPEDYPFRAAPAFGGYHTGVLVTGTFQISGEATGLKLEWSRPASAGPGDAVIYMIQYAARADNDLLASFSEFLELQGEDGEAAPEFLESLFPWNSIDAGLAQDYVIPGCPPEESELSKPTHCLAADLGYDVKVLAFVDTDLYESRTIQLSVNDIGMLVNDLTYDLSDTTTSTISWNPPTLSDTVADANPIIGYAIKIKYHEVGNADWDTYYEETFTKPESVFSNELLRLSDKSRYQLDPTQLSFSLDGCYHDFVNDETHCLRPWTQYRVSITALGTVVDGVAKSIYIKTAESAPDHPPTAFQVADTTSDKTTVIFEAPEKPTGLITGFTFRAVDNRGDTHTRYIGITRSLEDQIASTNYTIEVPDLPPFTTFTFDVAAHTSAGKGEYATSAFTTTTDEGVPDQMSPPSIKMSNNKQADGSPLYVVSWDEPYPLPGIILRYDVWKSTEDGSQGELLYSGLDKFVEVPDIGTGVRTQAHTSAGGSELSLAGTLPAASSSSSSSKAVVGGAVGGIAALAIIVVLFVIHQRKKATGKELDDVYVVPKPDQWEFNRAKLEIGKQLGEGAFGVVCKGTALGGIREFKKDTPCAVKQCAGENITNRDRNDFIDEATLMKKFAKPFHKNVIRLLGVCTQEEPMYIIVEFMEHGDLKEFLRARRPGKGRTTLLRQWMLLRMCKDIVEGMNFLEKAKFVHRDLACRNCLVGTDMLVKIADFGMSRDVNYSDYYRKNGEALMPVRWMAPESLGEGLFTSHTDVWSMGVVLWEVITYANMPYPGMSNQEVYEQVLAGYKMTKPRGCPDELFGIMKSCWENKEERPTFADLMKDIGAVYEKIKFAQVGKKFKEKEAIALACETKTMDKDGAEINPKKLDDEGSNNGDAAPEDGIYEEQNVNPNNYTPFNPNGDEPQGYLPMQQQAALSKEQKMEYEEEYEFYDSEAHGANVAAAASNVLQGYTEINLTRDQQTNLNVQRQQNRRTDAAYMERDIKLNAGYDASAEKPAEYGQADVDKAEYATDQEFQATYGGGDATAGAAQGNQYYSRIQGDYYDSNDRKADRGNYLQATIKKEEEAPVDESSSYMVAALKRNGTLKNHANETSTDELDLGDANTTMNPYFEGNLGNFAKKQQSGMDLDACFADDIDETDEQAGYMGLDLGNESDRDGDQPLASSKSAAEFLW